ncbi:MAG: type II secretion system F family protein [Deltaproteobacteria bacterium]|nr:type II secretion system F family protein [Deltaproteobacteria bacterium]
MPTFRCKISTKAGHTIEKTLISSGKNALKAHLEKEGYFVIDIRRVEGLGGILRHRRRVRGREFQVFNQEFAVLIKAGLPILGALNIIIEKRGEGEFTQILEEIRKEIAGGASVSEAFGKYAHVFSNLYVATLQAGEKSGDMPLAIRRYVDYLKKVNKIRQKVISASAYPLILLLASTFVVFFLLTYVIPSFTRTFFDAQVQMPALTMALIGASFFIRSHLLIITGFFLCLVLGYVFYRKSETGRKRLDSLKLHWPFLGDLYRHYSLSKFSRTLAMVLHGGTPLVDSLRISSGPLDNVFIKNALEIVADNIEKGKGFSEALGETGIFPGLALSMIEAGEKSGALEQVLEEVADFYEADVDTGLSILTSSIEPALMIIMGLLIGFIVLAMYLPIFQMAGAAG